MITISCTKKLFELSNFPEEQNTSQNDEFFNWHANVFRLARRNNIIFMNNKTRYCFILFGVKKDHFHKVKDIFISSLVENLQFEKIKQEQINKYVANIDQIRFTKTYDRSVLGSMIDMVRMTEFMVEHYLPLKEMNIKKLNKDLNHSPIVKLKNFPDIMMKEALSN
ncbi:hypothetical protein FE782_31905 [Paenibacillus antri]|uniref:DUF6933 domain-containing protein n=1 Tax=Paenibacillus antri TaxID=2582848 RepID=A0A5R9G251_9BACL|nr:hypothetical protein [Paenibacillus antri]TLS48220.1 hypothetical protein FE782_31905 [Paenibacillus antri]